MRISKSITVTDKIPPRKLRNAPVGPRIRKTEKAFDGGDFYVIKHSESAIAFVREKDDCRIIVAANRGGEFKLTVPECARYLDLLSGEEYSGRIAVDPDSVLIMKEILK